MESPQDDTADPGSALAQHFQSIQDPQLRLSSLTRLIRTLSPWEARHARIQLQGCKLEDLPVELVGMIVRFLNLDDVYSCFLVSRGWHRIWTSPVIVECLSPRFFPLAPKPFTLAGFRQASRMSYLRQHGHYKDKLEIALQYETEPYFKLDPGFHPEGRYPRLLGNEPKVFSGFSNGRVLWHIGHRIFVVDDLGTRKRKVLEVNKGLSALQGRARPPAMLISQHLVVLIYARQLKISAFHLTTNAWSTFSMPADMAAWQAEGDRIAIMAQTWELYVLQHDGRRLNVLRHIDVGRRIAEKRPSMDLHPRQCAVLFNPVSMDTLYIGLNQRQGTIPPTYINVPVEIVELQGEELVAVYPINPLILRHDLHHPTWPVGSLITLNNGDFVKAGDHGLWSTGLFIDHNSDYPPPEEVHLRGTSMAFGVFFNTITREISTQGYFNCFDGTPGSTSPKFFWDNRRFEQDRTAGGNVLIRSYGADAVNGEWKKPSTPVTYEISAGFLPPLDLDQPGDLQILHDRGYTLSQYIDRYVVWSFLEEDGCTDGY